MNNNIIEESSIQVNDSNFSDVVDSIINDATEVAEETTEEVTSEEAAPIVNIPLNPPILDETTARFSSAEWFESIKETSITLAGLGGIGSYVCYLLGRLKPRLLELYDPDRVEAVNMSGQMFGTIDIDNTKASACVRQLSLYSDYHSVHALSEELTTATPIQDIMICGFDNMEARKKAFYSWCSRTSRTRKGLFIDGRLNAEEFQIFCMTAEDDYLKSKYNTEYLFSDSEVESEVCSYKQTSFCAMMIASVMVNLLVNYICNTKVDMRVLPFKTVYNCMSMNLNTYDS